MSQNRKLSATEKAGATDKVQLDTDKVTQMTENQERAAAEEGGSKS